MAIAPTLAWSKIELSGFESPDCLWIRTVFQSLYECAGPDEYDVLALYRDIRPAVPTTLYLSPRATSRMRAAVSRFILTDCPRPETEQVELVLGGPLAWMTDWCEMPAAERAAYAQMVAHHDAELDALFDGPYVDLATAEN